MRVKVGSVAFLRAAGSGYGIGLTDDGHRVEFLGDWSSLSELQAPRESNAPIHVEIEDRQDIAIDDEPRVPMTQAGMNKGAAFIRSALRLR